MDIAEFYSIAHALAETPELLVPPGAAERMGDPIALRTSYARIAAATRTYFTDLCSQNPNAPNFPADVKSVLNKIDFFRHATINFNWDEEVDAYFSDGRNDVAYMRGAWRGKYTRLLLKPHGSINWYNGTEIHNRDCYFIADGDLRVAPPRRRLVAYYPIERPKRLDGQSRFGPYECPPLIAPPTFAKRFSYIEQQCVWQDVIQVCEEAREFVFLGYSLPIDDYLTKAVLRRALNPRRKGKVTVLVVLREGTTPATIANFRTIFGSAFGERNVFPCQFGIPNADASLGEEINRRLSRASLE